MNSFLHITELSPLTADLEGVEEGGGWGGDGREVEREKEREEDEREV